MVCNYLNVHFQGQRVKLPHALSLWPSCTYVSSHFLTPSCDIMSSRRRADELLVWGRALREKQIFAQLNKCEICSYETWKFTAQLVSPCSEPDDPCLCNFFCFFKVSFNTLRTSDADLRFYITTVQGGWRRFAFLHYNCARRVTQFCVFTLQLCKTGDAGLRFYITTVQDEWRRFAFLHYNCARRMTQICVFTYNCARRMTQICIFTLQLCKTDDADLRFYITTVQDGWRRLAFLHYNCARRMTQICILNTRLFSLHNTLN